MMRQISDKKVALLARKEEFLNELKYFEKRIEDARAQKANFCYFDDDESDDDLDFKKDTGPSISQLKAEQSMLKTCLDATRELTNLYVLQSEVNVLVDAPVFDREPPITDDGIWREVTADCRVDLVPFTIMFYVHQSSRPFGPASYRAVRVQPVKASQEKELAKSILPSVTKPSDAVEVLRSYSVAYRARRTILARLAQKYPNCVFMEPMDDGGYVLKCADLLEVSWMLQNKWSPVAGFHHKMKFDLEYMDEAYVKMISQAYKELSDPTIETDERMRLMSKMIAVCLEAKGPTQELYESMESEVESENLKKRRTTLDQEIEEPAHKRQKDSEVMAPPKSLPKKSKPKGKENNVDNTNHGKAPKRSVVDNKADGNKKAKLSDQGNIPKSAEANTKNNKNVEETDVVHDKMGKNVNVKMGDGKNNAAASKNTNKPTNNNKTNKQNSVKEVLISKGVSIPNNDVEKANNVENLHLQDSKQAEQVIKANTNKLPKNSEKNNKDVITVKPSIGKDVESSSNNVQANTNKVSSKENIDNNKDDKSNKVIAKTKNIIPKAKSTTNVNSKNVDSEEKKSNSNSKVASQKGIPKAKSTSNVNDNVARSDNILNKNDNLVNKKVNGKSIEKQKSINPKDLIVGRNNPKNDLNLQENAKSRTNDVIDKAKKNNPNSNAKKIENSDNIKTNKDNVKETASKKTDSNKTSKKAQSNENIPKTNTLQSDASKKALFKAKTDNPVKMNKKPKQINPKQHETLQKIVVKSSTNSKNIDKLCEKFENNTETANEPETNGKTRDANKKTIGIDKTYDIMDISEIKPISNNDNNTKKPTAIAKIVNTVKSKTQFQKIKTNVANPKTRKSLGLKAKERRVENDREKNTNDPSKKGTKIPLGLKHFHGDIVKKKSLRISPRKLQALKVDSQNSSKTSPVSLQRTGIPRLIKKLVPKLK